MGDYDETETESVEEPRAVLSGLPSWLAVVQMPMGSVDSMTEREMDLLAGIGERLGARLLDDAEDEDMETAQAVINTLVLFADHGKVPEPLLDAIAHQIRSTAAKHGRRLMSGLGGTRRGQATTRTM